jgi:hypothetical protein
MMSAIPNMTNSTYDTETIRNLDSWYVKKIILNLSMTFGIIFFFLII